MTTAKNVLFIIAACTCLVCAVFVLPLTHSAEGGVEAALCAAEEKLLISSAEDWNAFAGEIAAGEGFFGKTLTLTADISGNILPLGSKETPFCGTLDGAGHIVYSDIDGEDYTAPVGYLSLGAVRRLGVHGDMSGEQAVGGVVGFNDHGRVKECYHFGTVSADNYAGGVVGENRGEIIDCYNIGDVRARGEGRFAGGIAATNDYDGKIENCYAVSRAECDIYGGAVGYAGRGGILNCGYDSSLCDRAYSEAGNAVLDITAMTSDQLAGTALSDAFAVYGKSTEGWTAYPRLIAVDGKQNELALWGDHLISGDLIMFCNGESSYIVGRQNAYLPNPDRTGYSFTGWFTQDGERVLSAEGSGDIRLYARFEIISYIISFDLGGGEFAEGFAPALTYTVESGAVLPGEGDIVMDGMSFSGWVDEEGNAVESIPAGSVGNITLKAEWKPTAIAVISDVGNRYFWVIADVALGVILLIEAAAIARVRKRRRAAVYAFAPFSAGMIFYPGGFILACAELALILLMPLLLIRRRHAAAVAAEQIEYPKEAYFEEEEESVVYGLGSPERRLMLPAFEPLRGVEAIDLHMRYRNSFTARLAMSNATAKELYRSFKSYALSFNKVKSRISWGGETFHAGRKRLAVLTVAGNCLRIYFALDLSEVPARYKAEFKGGVKKYSATPAMVKVRSRRAARRAAELFDAVAEKFGLTRAENAELVLDNEDVLQGRFSGREELLSGGYIRSDITFTSPAEDTDGRNSA